MTQGCCEILFRAARSKGIISRLQIVQLFGCHNSFEYDVMTIFIAIPRLPTVKPALGLLPLEHTIHLVYVIPVTIEYHAKVSDG